MTIYSDISKKIEPEIAEVLICTKGVADRLGIPFFLVGAKARDLVFSLIFNIPTRRASLDVDLGIKVKSWKEVTTLIDGILGTTEFNSINKLTSRFQHRNGTFVDIVPFGLLENPLGKIQWPSTEAVMSTIGFAEAYNYSINVKVSHSPILDIKVCTPPAMVMLKLISWDEKYPERTKDAQDIEFIMRKYIEAGNDSRLNKEDKDLLIEGFDYEKASARILGRDIAKIANDDTRTTILSIMEREIREDSNYRLITDMIKGRGSFDELLSPTLALLRELHLGISERR